MFGLAMGVRRFPERLPDAVNALFSGLNSAAVGLIVHAGFKMSQSAAATPLTKALVRII